MHNKVAEKQYRERKNLFSKTSRTFLRKSKYPQTIKNLNMFKLVKTKNEYQFSNLYRKDKITNTFLALSKQKIFYYKTRWNKKFQKRFTGRWFSNNEAFIISKLKNSKIVIQWWKDRKTKKFTKRKKPNFLQLRWEKTFYILNNKIHVRRKTKNKKYYEKLFRKYKKKIWF